MLHLIFHLNFLFCFSVVLQLNKGDYRKIRMLCFVLIAFFLNFSHNVFGSCFGTLAVVLASDFIYFFYFFLGGGGGGVR